jgi:hypothetical protein
MAAIDWPTPAAEYVNEDTVARQWMTPSGEYFMDGSTAAAGIVNLISGKFGMKLEGKL